MNSTQDDKLLHLPLIGLEYSGKSTILHRLRSEHAGASGAFRSLFTFTNHDNTYRVVVRFSSLQDEFRNFNTDLLVKKSHNMLTKHISNVDVFIPAMCVLVDRKTGALRTEYITEPLYDSKELDLNTVLIFLNVSAKFLTEAAPQVYSSMHIAERAVIEFEQLKIELTKHFKARELDGNRPLDKVSEIVSDLEELIAEFK